MLLSRKKGAYSIVSIYLQQSEKSSVFLLYFYCSGDTRRNTDTQLLMVVSIGSHPFLFDASIIFLIWDHYVLEHLGLIQSEAFCLWLAQLAAIMCQLFGVEICIYYVNYILQKGYKLSSCVTFLTS